jgi:hypothetical protein
MKLQAAETAMSQISASRRSEGQCNEDNEAAAATAALVKTKDHEIDKYRELAAAMERKVGCPFGCFVLMEGGARAHELSLCIGV